MKKQKLVLAVCAFLQAPSWAQQPPATTIQVTGSRLTRAETETSLPVTVLGTEDIAVTGEATVAEVLRTLTFNTQGSSTPNVGTTGQGATDVNLRGLGFGRTLVLVNGRRVPVDSAFFGFAVSTTHIPYSAVERIEVLREGASAIYGSDALGGVVNIILKKDFKGLEGMVMYSDPAKAGGTTQVYSLTGGMQGDAGGFMVALEHRKADAVRRADREYTRADYSNLGFGFLSNSFPPTYRATDLLGNGTNTLGPLTAASGCPSNLVRTSGTSTECRNPTADKTDLQPEFEVNSIQATGHWRLTPDLSLFGEAFYSTQDSIGRSPAVTITRAMTAANPSNPTRAATAANPVAGATRPVPISVQFALPDEYGRRLVTEATLHNVVGGLEWKPKAGDLNFYLQDSEQSADSFYENSIRTAAFNTAWDAGTINPFSVSRAADYAQFITTGARFTTSKLQAGGVNWAAPIPGFSLGGGPVRYAVGGEWRKESLIETCDPASGLTGNFCFPRPEVERKVGAVFVEAVAPVTKSLEVSYAGRRDDYDLPDFARNTNRLALRFQPLPALALRGSVAEGVRAPNLFELSSSSATITSTVIDTRRCAAVGGVSSNPACQPIAVTQTIKGGPTLKPEESRSETVGVVWSPARNLNFSLDYYRIKVDDQIANLSNQAVVDLEAQNFDLSQFSVSVTRDAAGLITAVTSGSANVPGFRTSGFDVEASFRHRIQRVGDYSTRFMLTYVREFARPAVPGARVLDAVGYVNQPEVLFNWTHRLAWRRWTFDATWNYIGEFDARSPEQAQVLNVADQGKIGAYQTFDVAVSWDAPWKGRFTLGARNIADKLPTLSRFAFGDFGYSRALHDVNGRVLFLSYRQTFL